MLSWKGTKFNWHNTPKKQNSHPVNDEEIEMNEKTGIWIKLAMMFIQSILICRLAFLEALLCPMKIYNGYSWQWYVVMDIKKILNNSKNTKHMSSFKLNDYFHTWAGWYYSFFSYNYRHYSSGREWGKIVSTHFCYIPYHFLDKPQYPSSFRKTNM